MVVRHAAWQDRHVLADNPQSFEKCHDRRQRQHNEQVVNTAQLCCVQCAKRCLRDTVPAALFLPTALEAESVYVATELRRNLFLTLTHVRTHVDGCCGTTVSKMK